MLRCWEKEDVWILLSSTRAFSFDDDLLTAFEVNIFLSLLSSRLLTLPSATFPSVTLMSPMGHRFRSGIDPDIDIDQALS